MNIAKLIFTTVQMSFLYTFHSGISVQLADFLGYLSMLVFPGLYL